MGTTDIGAEGDDIQIGVLLRQQAAFQASVYRQKFSIYAEGLLVLGPGNGKKL